MPGPLPSQKSNTQLMFWVEAAIFTASFALTRVRVKATTSTLQCESWSWRLRRRLLLFSRCSATSSTEDSNCPTSLYKRKMSFAFASPLKRRIDAWKSCTDISPWPSSKISQSSSISLGMISKARSFWRIFRCFVALKNSCFVKEPLPSRSLDRSVFEQTNRPVTSYQLQYINVYRISVYIYIYLCIYLCIHCCPRPCRWRKGALGCLCLESTCIIHHWSITTICIYSLRTNVLVHPSVLQSHTMSTWPAKMSNYTRSLSNDLRSTDQGPRPKQCSMKKRTII